MPEGEGKASLTMGSRAVFTLFQGTRKRFPTCALLTVCSPEQAKEFATKMLGAKLITKQTGAAGRVCNAVRLIVVCHPLPPTHPLHPDLAQVMLAERENASHEYYVAVLNDRNTEGPVLVVSAQGGMNIEEVAAKDPSAIITTPINFAQGLSKPEALGVAKKLGFKTESAVNEAADIFINLYKIFKEKDATQIEINPLGETTDGRVLWYVIEHCIIRSRL